MRERAPSIRYHHLDLWGDFVSSFSREFEGKKPWEMNDVKFGEVGNFIEKYLKKEIDTEAWVIQSFGRVSLEDFDMKRNYEIL